MTEPEDQTELASSQTLRKLARGFRLSELVGQTLEDRYLIDEMIGEGAMGAVFRARQIRLRRTVALKIPKPEYCQKKDFLMRFEREALTMAKLVHQNTVQIFDVFVSEDPSVPSFIAMEYVEGIELDKFLKDQKNDLTVEAVLHLLRQVAEALNAAHQHGIVHRDIKPSNIIVTMPQRVAKVMDFGIAKLEMEDAYQTSGQNAIGTPAYMAPEQVQGKKVTAATDVYAFSVMIYRLLTGQAPFDAKSTTELIFCHVSKTPIPVLLRNSNLPENLNAVLRQGLAKKPEERPQSAMEMVNNVARALSPMAKKCYADLFVHENLVSLASADTLSSDKIAKAVESFPTTPSSNRWPIIIGVGLLLFGFVVGTIGYKVLRHDPGPIPPHVNNLVAEASPVPTPEETPTIIPSVEDKSETPVPESTPEPSPSTSPIVKPTPTPEPTASPSPVPTATPTPVPSPPEAADIFTEARRWNPELTPPDVSSFRRKSALEEIDRYLSDRIQTPTYYKQFDAKQNDLAKVAGPAGKRLIERIQIFQQRHEEVALSFEILADDSIVWSDHALVLLRAKVVGRPPNHPARNYRKTLLEVKTPIEARLERDKEGNWQMTSIERFTDD